MDEGDRRELRALHARAYGPSADIHAEPAALARLHELEALAAADAKVVTAPLSVVAASASPRVAWAGVEAPAIPSPPRQASASVVASDAEAWASDEEPTTSSPSPPPRRRGLLVAAVVAAAVLVGGLGGAWIAGQTSASGGRLDTALAVDEDFEAPTWLDQNGDDTLLGYRDFHGLTPVSTEQDWNGMRSDVCLAILTTADMSLDGWGSAYNVSVPNCASDPFPATVSITVDRVAPEALRNAFPLGTSLQFVLTGGEVRVYAADPEPAAPTETSEDAGSAGFHVECTDCAGTAD